MLDFILLNARFRLLDSWAINERLQIRKIRFCRVWKKWRCNIFVLNAKSSIVTRTISTAFLSVKAEILNISFDLWLLLFAQTIKRQNSVDESKRDLKTWRNSIFFSRAIIFFFSFVVLRYFCHVCFMRNADRALCLRRVIDTTSTHFWF